MALSYEFSIGSVRAREKHLFTEAEVEQMLALREEQELLCFLKDKGYGEGQDIPAVLESHTRRMWQYIRSVAPDMAIFEPFLLQNDIHNLKTVLKGVMTGKKIEPLLMEPCTIPKEEIIEAVENRRFDRFPLWLRRPADRAYQLIAETKDARLSDAYVDKAVMLRLLECGKMSRSVFLEEYFGAKVFYANVKIALRGAAVKVRKLYLEKALCDCRGVDKETVIRLTMQGTEPLVKYLEKRTDYDCMKAMTAFSESPLAFEKFMDNYLLQIAARCCRLTSEGPEPLLGYYVGCVYEQKLIEILAGGIHTRTSPDILRERLRDIYG